MSIAWVLLAVWFASLALFVALRVRATRGRALPLENVRRLPLRPAAASPSASLKSTATSHHRAASAHGSLAAAAAPPR